MSYLLKVLRGECKKVLRATKEERIVLHSLLSMYIKIIAHE